MRCAAEPRNEFGGYIAVTKNRHATFAKAMIRATLVAFLLTFWMCGQPAAQTIALVGATVIDGAGGPRLENAVILIEGDRLTCVGTAEACAVPSGVDPVDLSGRFITPGLVDAHVQFSQTGWFDGRPDGISAPDLYP